MLSLPSARVVAQRPAGGGKAKQAGNAGIGLLSA
jgi:hypothetical protein